MSEELYQWQEMPSIVCGDDDPIRTGEIELRHCPVSGDFIEVGPEDQLRISKVVHRPGKPGLLVC